MSEHKTHMVIRGDGTMAPLEDVFHVRDYASVGLRGFLCPECEGAHYGSYDPHDGGEWVRSCHDQFGTGCRWSGRTSEALDDSEDLTIHPFLRERMPNNGGVGGTP